MVVILQLHLLNKPFGINEDNRGDDDRDIDYVKKHIKHEMECLLGPIKQIDLDKLLGTDELTEKAHAVMKEIQEEAEKENEKPRTGGLKPRS